MVAVPLADSLRLPGSGESLAWGNAGEVIVPPRGHPSTVTVSCPPRAMTLGVATMLLGVFHATAMGAASPTAATAAADTARARVVRM
jgi:hypothetical protein